MFMNQQEKNVAVSIDVSSEPVPGSLDISARWSGVVHNTKVLLEQNPARSFRVRLETSLPLLYFPKPTDHMKHASVNLSHHPR